MTTVIVWERPDGAITYQVPAYNDIVRPADDIDGALIERCLTAMHASILEEFGGEGIPHIVEDTEVPSDHTCSADCPFFNAFEWTVDRVTVNMVKAREIKGEQIRRAFDGEIPPTFDLNSFANPGDLEAAWPVEL